MMTTRLPYLFFLTLFAVFFKPWPAAAQTQISCETVPAMITRMTEPQVGALNLWDSVFGLKQTDNDYIGALQKDEEWLVAGHSTPIKPDARQSLLLVGLDAYGRKLWHKIHDIEGLMAVNAIVPHPQGALILATIERNSHPQIWLGFMDEKAEITRHKWIGHKKDGLIADSIVQTADGKSYIITAHTQTVPDKHDTSYTELYRIDTQGRITGRRSMNFGTNNRTHTLVAGTDQTIIALGEITEQSGRSAGWGWAIDSHMDLVWQQTYPRGIGASFTAGAALSQSPDIIVAGHAQPSDGEPQAAWIARIEPGKGNIIWERYLRGLRTYESVMALSSSDDILSLILKGHALETVSENTPPENAYAFLRMITMNKRGLIMHKEDHLNAKGLDPTAAVFDETGRRILIGSTRAPDLEQFDKQAELADIPHTKQGWIAAVPATDTYDDPCDRSR